MAKKQQPAGKARIKKQEISKKGRPSRYNPNTGGKSGMIGAGVGTGSTTHPEGRMAHRHDYSILVSTQTLRDGTVVEVRKCECGKTEVETTPPPRKR